MLQSNSTDAARPFCPSCRVPMQIETFERSTNGEIALDICYPCRAIWFDHMESTQLAPGGVIALFKRIHEHRASDQHQLASQPLCARCKLPLRLTNDIQISGRISYYRCD